MRIIRLTVTSDSPIDHYFVAPDRPGNHYNATASFYSSNKFVEYNSVNLTSVYGYSLDLSHMLMEPLLDKLTQGVYYFKFQIGSEKVPAGNFLNLSNKILKNKNKILKY